MRSNECPCSYDIAITILCINMVSYIFRDISLCFLYCRIPFDSVISE